MAGKRSLFRLFLWFVVALSGLQICFLWHYNSLFNAQNADAANEIQQMADQSSKLSPESTHIVQQLKQNYQGVTVSPNGQYATYVESNSDGSYVLHVEDLPSGKQVSEATNLYPVQYVSWLGEEELFVGEQKAPGDLELNTVYVSNGDQANQTAASVPQFSSLAPDAVISKVAYSTQTNDVFVLITSSGSSALYHIGTMENVQSVPFSDGYIKNIAMSPTGKDLYVESRSDGTWNIFRLDQSSTDNADSPEYLATPQLAQADAALITVSGNSLYYGKINADGLVTSVYRENGNGSSALVKELSSAQLAGDLAVDSSGNVLVNPISTSSVSI
ncbi:hypothetical protein NZD89_18330 [Alicyclobacillus fastidiosus]|uniref:Uncharacterized protein n=1 Tax=Alicyclobacillus fastidiosus TaxID=392011 RepID=A0ABY6ZBT7_9BACL|nr:hypothetical protein [Alicyclobacillus fastidiosus]WAH40314.1 hypothetical protein NZD89_18330 [Alicyclobacillus fastidiosus]GMA61696.1 hypothetical protein GCM10025859_21360 [Alicyclobacillus fastidiosus]